MPPDPRGGLPVEVPVLTAHPCNPRLADCAAHPLRLAGLVALAVAGCVDVPDQSPMGGAPMQDAAPPDARESDAPDGELADVELVDDDDPEAPEVDGGGPGVGEFDVSGRPDDARPGPEGEQERPLHAPLDPERCPEGGALLPALAACVHVEPLPRLPTALVAAAAVALPDGRVLVAGGAAFEQQQPSGETWVLEDDGWRAGPELAEPVRGPRAALRDGLAVVVGGQGGPEAGSAVQALDADDALPITMLDQPRRGGFSAHRFEDRVVVVGGDTLGDGVAGVELARSPEAQVDEAIGQLAVARRGHAAAVDVDGALWILGGRDRRGQVRFAPEVLSPGETEWISAPGPAGWAFEGGAAAATGESVLFAGGADADGHSLDRAGIYDHQAQGWLPVGGLNQPQSTLVMAPLGEEGAVLAIGPGTLEVYDPVEQAFRLLSAGGVLLRSEPAVAVVDGRVLVIGGANDGRILDHGYAVRLVPAEPAPADGQESAEGEGAEGAGGAEPAEEADRR